MRGQLHSPRQRRTYLHQQILQTTLKALNGRELRAIQQLPVKTESPVEFWSGVFGWSSMNNSALDRPDGERHEESLEH